MSTPPPPTWLLRVQLVSRPRGGPGKITRHLMGDDRDTPACGVKVSPLSQQIRVAFTNRSDITCIKCLTLYDKTWDPTAWQRPWE